MLSRTADHLYWLSRYLERAETIARMLEAEHQLSLLPRTAEVAQRTRRATLVALGAHELYDSSTRRGNTDALEFLAFDREYPVSIVSCIARARENARAVRGTVASELWETINAAWLESRAFERRSGPERIRGLFEFVRQRSHTIRGISVVAMLRDEAYHFMRLGTFLERADGTARMLDARLANLDDATRTDGSEWTVLLRTLSSFEAYRKLFREAVTPQRVVEMLVLRAEVPRSLRRCIIEVRDNIRSVANSASLETERKAGALQAMLEFGRPEDLALADLSAYLTDKIERLTQIGDGIARDFLISDVTA
jgi:uncharacterized alpha-E superfamily protein